MSNNVLRDIINNSPDLSGGKSSSSSSTSNSSYRPVNLNNSQGKSNNVLRDIINSDPNLSKSNTSNVDWSSISSSNFNHALNTYLDGVTNLSRIYSDSNYSWGAKDRINLRDVKKQGNMLKSWVEENYDQFDDDTYNDLLKSFEAHDYVFNLANDRITNSNVKTQEEIDKANYDKATADAEGKSWWSAFNAFALDDGSANIDRSSAEYGTDYVSALMAKKEADKNYKLYTKGQLEAESTLNANIEKLEAMSKELDSMANRMSNATDYSTYSERQNEYLAKVDEYQQLLRQSQSIEDRLDASGYEADMLDKFKVYDEDGNFVRNKNGVGRLLTRAGQDVKSLGLKIASVATTLPLELMRGASYEIDVERQKLYDVIDTVGRDISQEQFDALDPYTKQILSQWGITGADLYNSTANNTDTSVSAREETNKDFYEMESLGRSLYSESDKAFRQANYGLTDTQAFMHELIPSAVGMAQDALLNIAVPGAGLASMFARVYSDSYNEALTNPERNLGIDNMDDAALYGLASASIEVATELLGNASLLNKISYSRDGIVETLRNLANKDTLVKSITQGAFGEGMEEVLAEFAGPLAEAILGSDYGAELKRLRGEQTAEQYAKAFASGAIMALGGNAIGTTGAALSRYKGNDAQSMLDDLNRYGDDKAKAYASKLQSQISAKQGATIEDGATSPKGINNYTARQLSKAVNKAYDNYDTQKITKFAEDMLTDLGESQPKGTSRYIAEELVKASKDGLSIDEAAYKLKQQFKGNDNIVDVINALSSDMVRPGSKVNVRVDYADKARILGTTRTYSDSLGSQTFADRNNVTVKEANDFRDFITNAMNASAGFDLKSKNVDILAKDKIIREANIEEGTNTHVADDSQLLLDLSKGVGNNAKLVVENYSEGQMIDDYVAEMNVAINMLAVNGATLEQMHKYFEGGTLTDKQIEAAYNRGHELFEAKNAEAKAKGEAFRKQRNGSTEIRKGSVSTDGGSYYENGEEVKLKAIDMKKLSKAQKGFIRTIEQFAEHISLNFVFFDGDAREAQGIYTGGNTIYININAGGVVNEMFAGYALSHELTHFLEAYAPEDYNKLANFIKANIMEISGGRTWEQLYNIEAEKMSANATQKQIEAEVIANSCLDMLESSAILTKLYQEDKSLAGKIRSTINKIMQRLSKFFPDTIGKYYAGYNPSSKNTLGEAFKQKQELWDNAFKEALLNVNADVDVNASYEAQYLKAVTDPETLSKLNRAEKEGVVDFKDISKGKGVVKVYRAMQAQPVDENGNVIPNSSVRRIVSTNPLVVEAKVFETVGRKKVSKTITAPAKLFSPMAGQAEKGVWRNPINLDEWEMSEGRLDRATLKRDKDGNPVIDNDKKNASYGEPVYEFGLEKGGVDDNGKPLTSVPARYNPYVHTSLSALNDQFSSANKRPELVTVETLVPVFHINSGERLPGAKDRVGPMSWHSGPTSSRLAKVDKARVVILSRYDKPVRVLSDDEVASSIAKFIGDTENISIQESTVTPSLASELKALGVSVLGEEDWKNYAEENPVKTFGKNKAQKQSWADNEVKQGNAISPDVEVQYSKWHNDDFMQKAYTYNKNTNYVPNLVMQEAERVRKLVNEKLSDPKLIEEMRLPDDEEGNTFMSNSSYGGSEEQTTVCIRSLAAQSFMDEVSKALGRPLTTIDTLIVSQEMMNYAGDMSECLYCYVAQDRRAYRDFLGKYLEQRDSALADLASGMDKEEAYKKFLGHREHTTPMRQRFDLWASTKAEDLITPNDLASVEDLLEEIATNRKKKTTSGIRYRQLNDAAKYAQSASWAKKMKQYSAYNGHILKWKQDRINLMNSHFGLRMYSFSDFHPAFILENMQEITDASVRGLKMLAYTKETDFAEIFAPTGMNINISVFASEVNGQIQKDGMMGADWDKAIALRKKYPNVGITLVATNDNLLKWGLENDDVDVVIPYHLVRTGAETARFFNYINYTDASSDGKLPGAKQKEVYPAEHNNDLITYMDKLAEFNLTPRFPSWLNKYDEYRNGEITADEFREENPYYMKLVNETRRSAVESPAVQPIFDEDAALRSIENMKPYQNTLGQLWSNNEKLQKMPLKQTLKIINDMANIDDEAFRATQKPDYLKKLDSIQSQVDRVQNKAQHQQWQGESSSDYASEAKDRSKELVRLKAENAALEEHYNAIQSAYNDLAKTVKTLEKSNKKLTEKNKKLIAEFKDTPLQMREEDLTKLAREYAKEYGVETKELAYALSYLANGVLLNDKMSYEQYKQMALDLASMVIDKANVIVDDNNVELHNYIKGYLKNTIVVPKENRNDLDGGYDAYKKAHFGTIKLGNKGEAIDTVYEQMQEAYGESLFPDVSPAEMVERIVELYDATAPVYGNPYEGHRVEAAQDLANRMIADISSEKVRMLPQTFKDKMQMDAILKAQTKVDNLRKTNEARISKLKANASARLEQRVASEKEAKWDALEKANEKFAERLSKAKANKTEAVAKANEKAQKRIDRLNERLAEERNDKWQRVSDIKNHYRQKESDARYRRQNKTSRTKIGKLINQLNSMLKHPTETKHIPVELTQLTIDILKMIDRDTGKNKSIQKDIANMAKVYESYKNNERYSMVYDDVVAQSLQTMYEQIGSTPLNRMTNDQLDAVYNVLKSLMHVARTAVKVKIGNEERNAFEVSTEMTRETRNAKVPRSDLVTKYLTLMLKPEDMFELLGGFKKDSAWSKMAKMFADAETKQENITMQLSLGFNDLVNNSKEMDKFMGYKEKDLVDIGLVDEDEGKVIKVSHDIMMGIYMDLLNEENKRHFLYAGKVIPNLSDFYHGKNDNGFGKKELHATGYSAAFTKLLDQLEEARAEKNDNKVMALEAEIAQMQLDADAWVEQIKKNIEDKMTDFDKQWLQACQELFDEKSKKILNDTTMEIYGITKANVEHYFPITTDKDFLSKPFESVTNDMNLENVGFMKQRIVSKKPTLALGVVGVSSRQISNVGQYAAIMPAMRTFNKVYGKTQKGYADSLQKAIHTKFGDVGLKYIDDIMGDLVGSRTAKGSIDKLFSFLRGNLAPAVLTGNPRVALAQTASFPTAAAKLGWKPIVKALLHGGKDGRVISRADKELIAQYSPKLWYRMQGYSSVEIGDIKNSNQLGAKIWRKLGWFTGWIQAFDGATVGRLWDAAQYYVDDNYPGLEKGSTEYYEKVAEVYNETINATQPVYGTFQRPAALRDPSALAKSLFMFMTQRLQNFNVTYASAAKYQRFRADYAKGLNNVTEEDVKNAQLDVLHSATAMVAQGLTLTVFKFLADVLLHNMDKYRDDDDELTAESIALKLLDMFIDAEIGCILFGAELYAIGKALLGKEKWYGLSVNGVDALTDTIQDLISLTTKPSMKTFTNFANDIAQDFGIPAKNAYNLVNAVLLHGQDMLNGEFLSFEAGLDRKDEQNASSLIKAYESGDTEAIAKYTAEFESEADALSAMQSVIRKQYQDDDISYDDAKEFLVEHDLAFDEDEADKMLYEWEKGKGSATVYDGITEALKSNDKEAFKTAMAEMTEHGYDESTIYNRVKTETEKMYVETKTIDKQSAIQYLIDYAGKDKADATDIVDQWTCKVVTGIDYNDIGDYYMAYVNGNKDKGITSTRAIEMLMRYGKLDKAKASEKVLHWELEAKTGIVYGSSTKGIKNAVIEGDITEKEASQYIVKYGGKTKEVADRYAAQYSFEKKTGYSWSDVAEAYKNHKVSESELVQWQIKCNESVHGSESKAKKYVELTKWQAKIDGFTMSNYDNYIKSKKYIDNANLSNADISKVLEIYKEAESQYDDNGNSVKNSRAKAVAQGIKAYGDKVGLTSSQMSALMEFVYAYSTVKKVKLW